MKTIVKKYDVSRCVLIVPASPHPFRSSQNRPSLLFSDFYILVRTIWCHSKLFYTTTIFSIISYFLTLLAALPFLPIVAKISGWTRPDRQPCLSFSCYAPEHYIYLAILRLFQQFLYYSRSLSILFSRPERQAPLSLVMHPSILQQDGHWTDPHSQTTINVTQQEITNISQTNG